MVFSRFQYFGICEPSTILQLMTILEKPATPDDAKIYITINITLEHMSEIVLQVPDDSLLALKMSPEELGKELRLAAAVKLFELGKLSSGAAARLAGIPRTLFLASLANYGVDTFRLTEEDLKAEAILA